MLTLESRCILLLVGLVLPWRTINNSYVIHKRFQTFCLFHGTIVTDTLEWEITYNYNHSHLSCVSHKLRLVICWVSILILSFLFLLWKLRALHKVGTPLVLRLISIEKLSCYVDLFNIGVDSIRLYMLRY